MEYRSEKRTVRHVKTYVMMIHKNVVSESKPPSSEVPGSNLGFSRLSLPHQEKLQIKCLRECKTD